MDNTKKIEACRGCGKPFLSNNILRHLARAKKCKEAYGKDFESFRVQITKANSRARTTRYKEKNPEKVRTSKAKYR